MPFKRSSSESGENQRQTSYSTSHIYHKKRSYPRQYDENISSNNPLSLTSKSKRERLQREEIERNVKYHNSHRSIKNEYYYENQRIEEIPPHFRIRKQTTGPEIEETKKSERHSHKNKEHSNKREIRKHKKSRDHKDKPKRDIHHSRSKKDIKRRKSVDDDDNDQERECSNEHYAYVNDNLNNDSDTNEEVLRKRLLKESSLDRGVGSGGCLVSAHEGHAVTAITDKNLDIIMDHEFKDADERESSVNQYEEEEGDDDDEEQEESLNKYIFDIAAGDDVPNDGYEDYRRVRSKFESSSIEESDMDNENNDSRENDTHSESSNSSSSYGSSISSSRNPKKIRQKKQAKKDENKEEKLVFSPVKDKEESDIYVDHRPFYYPAVQGCRLVEEFECLNKIEEGTYGVVFRARDRKTNEIVALKRLKMEKERDGFPITSLREINTLMKARHLNIVTVREIVVGSNMDKIYLVMDFIEHDLKSLMLSMVKPFEICEVKCLMLQLLNAVAHLHDNWILHRDLKTSNLLLSHRGVLKVADFGLAREYGSPLKNYTRVVVTLWYRAPELLLGTKVYSTQIDLWSVGCIFGELLLMGALFPGKSEMDQINILFRELGTPNEKIWPGFSNLPNVKRFEFGKYEYNRLSRRFGAQLSESGLELINKFLAYCPERRITAEEALKHHYFIETPTAISPEMFPTRPAKSEGAIITARSIAARLAPSPKPPSGGGQGVKCLSDDRFLDNLFLRR